MCERCGLSILLFPLDVMPAFSLEETVFYSQHTELLAGFWNVSLVYAHFLRAALASVCEHVLWVVKRLMAPTARQCLAEPPWGLIPVLHGQQELFA